MKASELANHLTKLIHQCGDRDIVNTEDEDLVAFAAIPGDQSLPFVCIFAPKDQL